MPDDSRLTADDVRQLLERLEDNLPRDECATCDCLLGFVTQLQIDAVEDVTDLVTPWQVPREDMHHCLGCDPCPPAELYAEYLRHKNRL
jgi:hypothetical protein